MTNAAGDPLHPDGRPVARPVDVRHRHARPGLHRRHVLQPQRRRRRNRRNHSPLRWPAASSFTDAAGESWSRGDAASALLETRHPVPGPRRRLRWRRWSRLRVDQRQRTERLRAPPRRRMVGAVTFDLWPTGAKPARLAAISRTSRRSTLCVPVGAAYTADGAGGRTLAPPTREAGCATSGPARRKSPQIAALPARRCATAGNGSS